MKHHARRVWVLATILAGAIALPVCAQESSQKPADTKAAETKSADNAAPKEETSVTDHTIRIGGENIAYKATAGTIMLKNDKDEPTALVFSTAYIRSDVKDLSHRPITFIYNGGPGSSSIWQHMGAWGPKRVVVPDAKSAPPAPYPVIDNQYCLLDVSDLVFIDPVGTGFSHPVGKAEGKDFWGVDEDIKSLAQFITKWVSRNGRWNSPKYLLGESYGTFRSAALVDYLQQHESMDFNGVVLLSSVLDLGTITFPQGVDLPYVLYLPTYAATAAYHHALASQPGDLNALLDEVRQFAAGEYATALLQGDKLSTAQRDGIIKKLSGYTGLSEDYIRKADLRVGSQQFMAELQRNRDLNTGRLDARYSGPMEDLLTEYAEYDPQSTGVSSAFASSWNEYVRNDLKFGGDLRYEVLNGKANQAWNWKREHGGGFPGAPNVEGDLEDAMVMNPHLQVEIENGLYDLATPFFGSEYTVTHIGLPEAVRGNIHLQYYNAGHMMYLQDDSLAKLKANVARFITGSHS